jgi:hypothetical protein
MASLLARLFSGISQAQKSCCEILVKGLLQVRDWLREQVLIRLKRNPLLFFLEDKINPTGMIPRLLQRTGGQLTSFVNVVPPDHRLLDSAPNLGPHISRWELEKSRIAKT